MSKPEILAGIDIGSGQLTCAIGRRQPDQDQVEIITAGSSHLNNIWRSINNAGFGIREAVYGLLALGDVVVTQEEKDLGCMLLDLGGATTGMAIYTDGGVRFTKELPVGADAITND